MISCHSNVLNMKAHAMNNSPKEITRRLVGSALAAVTIAVLVGNATAAVRYVNVANPNPRPPYFSWGTAATTIQDAVDAAHAGNDLPTPGNGLAVACGACPRK